MRAILTLALMVLGFSALAEPAVAQLVIVRPGYVQAPFVRVYRDPYGGAHVRAPFVRVDQPGYFIHTPRTMHYRTPQTVRPNYAPLAGTPQEQLFDAMVALRDALSRFNTAETWTAYFALDPGGTLSPEHLANLDGVATPDLVAMLDRFDRVIANPEFEVISSLSAFSQARNELAQYIATAKASQAEELPVPEPNAK